MNSCFLNTFNQSSRHCQPKSYSGWINYLASSYIPFGFVAADLKSKVLLGSEFLDARHQTTNADYRNEVLEWRGDGGSQWFYPFNQLKNLHRSPHDQLSCLDCQDLAAAQYCIPALHKSSSMYLTEVESMSIEQTWWFISEQAKHPWSSQAGSSSRRQINLFQFCVIEEAAHLIRVSSNHQMSCKLLRRMQSALKEVLYSMHENSRI